MNEVHDEFDYSRTGAGSGMQPMIIINTKKDSSDFGKFQIGDTIIGDEGNSFSAFFRRLDIEYRDAVPEHRIPAHWTMYIILAADLGDGPKDYRMPIHAHWSNPIVGNIINSLAGLLETQWDRYIRFWSKVKHPATGLPYPSILVFKSENMGDFAPYKFPYNDNGYDGVPQDFTAASEFWVDQANLIRLATGGLLTNAHNAPKYTPSMMTSGGMVNPASAPTVSTGTTVQAPVKEEESQKKEMTKTQFLKIVREKYLKGDDANQLLAGLNSSLAGFTKYQPEGMSSADILSEFNNKLSAIEPGSSFVQKGNKAEYFPAIDDKTPAPRTEPADDLPF